MHELFIICYTEYKSVISWILKSSPMSIEPSPRPTFGHSNHAFSILGHDITAVFFVALTTQVDGQFDTPFPFSIVRCCSGGHIHFIHPIFRRQPEIAKKYHVKGLTRIFFVFMHQHIMKKVYKETKPSK